MILFVSGVDVSVGGQQQPSNFNASVRGAVVQGGPFSNRDRNQESKMTKKLMRNACRSSRRFKSHLQFRSLTQLAYAVK